jgi:hypothetical protein
MREEPKSQILIICNSKELTNLIYEFFAGEQRIKVCCITQHQLKKNADLVMITDLAIIETLFIIKGIPDLVQNIRFSNPSIPILILADYFIKGLQEWSADVGNITILEANTSGKKVLSQILELLNLDEL